MNEFREAQRQLKGPGMIGWWEDVLPRLSPEQETALRAAAADRTISHRAVKVVLERWGFPVTLAQIGHWRRTHVS